MEETLECPHCGLTIPKFETPEAQQLVRVVHWVDHALRATIGLGVFDVGDIEVDDYTVGRTWAQAARCARDVILCYYGDQVNNMIELISMIKLRPEGAPIDQWASVSTGTQNAKAEMLEWLDANASANPPFVN